MLLIEDKLAPHFPYIAHKLGNLPLHLSQKVYKKIKHNLSYKNWYYLHTTCENYIDYPNSWEWYYTKHYLELHNAMYSYC